MFSFSRKNIKPDFVKELVESPVIKPVETPIELTGTILVEVPSCEPLELNLPLEGEELLAQPKILEEPIKKTGEIVLCTGAQCRRKLFFMDPPNRPLCTDCVEKLY